LPNERYFAVIRELDEKDDEHDPGNWIKANPLRAATPAGLAKLKEQHDEAFGSKDPEKIRNFRVKNLNRFVNETEASYMGDDLLKIWNELAVSREKFIELTKNGMGVVGCDLSKKTDLTGDAFLFDLGDERVAICARGFMPDGGMDAHEKTDKIPYRAWRDEGWLTVTEGNVTDYEAIKAHIHDVELEHGWTVLEFAYDPYNATHLANELQRDGYTIVEVRQGVQTLSEPTKLFREMVMQGKIVHDGSPLLTWCLANARTVQDNNENIKLSKKNASDTKRIDLASSVMNAMTRLQALREANEGSVYKTRGIRTL